MILTLNALLVGQVQPFGPRGEGSGIAKRPVAGPVFLSRLGLAGDGQGDLRHHGGPDKAVHHYARTHYDAWRVEIGPRSVLNEPGAFGENFSTHGVTEADICLGDVFALGGAVLEVSQGRQPCWKLNHRFDCPDMALRVQRSGRTGWYYRVRQEGTVAAGNALELLDRPLPHWPLTRLLRLLYVETDDRDGLQEMARLPLLPDTWRRLALRRLETGQVEDWRRRLIGPDGVHG